MTTNIPPPEASTETPDTNDLRRLQEEWEYQRAYLENLVEGLCGEVEALERRIRLQETHIKQLQEQVDAWTGNSVSGDSNSAEQDDHIDSQRISNHPLLSSIPPRQLSDEETRHLLAALDEITSQKSR